MDDDTILHLIARVNVLENFMRVMCRLLGKDVFRPEQLLAFAEAIKQDQEANLNAPTAAYMTAAVDNFFNSLASELRKYQGKA